MIYPQELMANNYVFSIGHNMVTQIHSVLPDNIRLWCNPLALYDKLDIKPVALNDEILIKSGFKKVSARLGVDCAFIKDGIRVEKSNSGLFYHKGNAIKLHHLQNIFVILKQKELEVVI